jgi:hypothetical protein
MVADGKLNADNLIWKEGMANWIPVSKVPALVKYLKKPAVEDAPPATKVTRPAVAKLARVSLAEPVAVVDQQPLPVDSGNDINQVGTEGQVGYYNPAAGLPPRAAATLRKHAAPRGDIGDWPLDDTRVSLFDQAIKLRKRIDAAASLFRLFLFLAVIGDVVSILVVVFAFASTGGARLMATVIPMGISAGVSLGVTALYYFAWKGTTRSQMWAPLTMGILFVLGGVGYAAALVFAAASSPRDATELYVMTLFLVLLAGAFAYVAFRAATAIPRYLQQPAWCQELLAKTNA